MLRQHGLALGGSLENAIVIGETGVLNNPLRFEDEFVRHKILDAMGDLALVGHPILGHLVAHRGGHALHTAFAAKLLEARDAWELVEQPVRLPARGRPVRGTAARSRRTERRSAGTSVASRVHVRVLRTVHRWPYPLPSFRPASFCMYAASRSFSKRTVLWKRLSAR